MPKIWGNFVLSWFLFGPGFLGFSFFVTMFRREAKGSERFSFSMIRREVKGSEQRVSGAKCSQRFSELKDFQRASGIFGKIFLLRNGRGGAGKLSEPLPLPSSTQILPN